MGKLKRWRIKRRSIKTARRTTESRREITKSKIVGQVFGWLGVALTAVAAVFNPALWAVVAIGATAMALQTAVDVMGENALRD